LRSVVLAVSLTSPCSGGGGGVHEVCTGGAVSATQKLQLGGRSGRAAHLLSGADADLDERRRLGAGVERAVDQEQRGGQRSGEGGHEWRLGKGVVIGCLWNWDRMLAK
jgi:hypothetical protein